MQPLCVLKRERAWQSITVKHSNRAMVGQEIINILPFGHLYLIDRSLKKDVADKFYDITCRWMIFCSFKACSPDWPVNTQNSERKQEKQ